MFSFSHCRNSCIRRDIHSALQSYTFVHSTNSILYYQQITKRFQAFFFTMCVLFFHLLLLFPFYSICVVVVVLVGSKWSEFVSFEMGKSVRIFIDIAQQNPIEGWFHLNLLFLYLFWIVWKKFNCLNIFSIFNFFCNIAKTWILFLLFTFEFSHSIETESFSEYLSLCLFATDDIYGLHLN